MNNNQQQPASAAEKRSNGLRLSIIHSDVLLNKLRPETYKGAANLKTVVESMYPDVIQPVHEPVAVVADQPVATETPDLYLGNTTEIYLDDNNADMADAARQRVQKLFNAPADSKFAEEITTSLRGSMFSSLDEEQNA